MTNPITQSPFLSLNKYGESQAASVGGASALWVDVTTDPTATGNTGTQPRYTNNTVTGKRYYIDANGVAKQVEQAAVGLTPDLSPVKDFKTQAQIDALGTASPLPNHGDSYIVSDGTHKGDIARWDSTANEGAGAWEYYVPADLDVTTVTNPDNETFQGKWRYDIVGDYWVQITTGITLPDVVERPVSAENIAFGRTTMPMTHNWSTGWQYAFIQNNEVALWGNSTIFTTATGSNSDASFPRKLSWNWYNGSGTAATYSPVGQYVPKFVDVSHTDTHMLALDHLGKVWAMSNQLVGTGMTTTPTSTVAPSRPPAYGLEPIPYFQGLPTVFISRIYTNNNKYAPPAYVSAAVSTSGDLYVTGNNQFGTLGQGNTTAYAQWFKLPITNVIDVKLVEYTLLALTATGDLYVTGHVGTVLGGATTRTTPTLIATGVAQFDFHSDANGANVLGIMAVKTDGTVWGVGNNASGQLGIGNTTNVTTFTRAVGVNNAKSVFCSRGVGAAAITGLLRTDGTVSFCGRNQEGQMGYTVATAAATYTTFVTPAFAAQGTVIEGMIGRVTTLRTASGDIWNAGHFGMRGLGDTSASANSWTNANIFQKVALPEAALAMRGSQSTSTAGNNDNCYVLTANNGIICWGSNYPGYISLNHQQYCYSPYRVDMVRMLNNGIAVSNPLGGTYDTAATITGITAGSIGNVVDGQNDQYISVNLTINGTAGRLDTTGATLTGADLTAVNQTTHVYETGTTGNQITLVFKVTTTDLIPVGGAAQTQNWVVTLGGFTYNLSSTRFNDVIAEKLTASLATYQSASVGTYIPITLAEWSALAGITGSGVAGKIDTPAGYTTNGGWTTLGIVFSAKTSATNSSVTLPVPANNYVFAFQLKTGNALTSQTYALGVLPAQTNAGLELVGTNGATGIDNTVQEFKAFVIKGGKQVTQSSDIAVWGGSFASKANSTAPLGSLSQYTGGTGANSAPLSTTSLTTAWTSSPFIQALYEPSGSFVR